MTRALIQLVKGNIQSYMDYNIMALPVSIAFALELFNKLFDKYKAIVHVYVSITLLTNLLYYAIRLYLIL